MKFHAKKNWINKFNHNEVEIGESIPVGLPLKLCGCGNIAIQKSDFCYECYEAYGGEDEI